MKKKLLATLALALTLLAVIGVLVLAAFVIGPGIKDAIKSIASQIPTALERLEKQGLVHKLVTDEGACWQYCDCHAHRDCILLKCEVCGAIQHMDCGHLGELYQHVLQRHHFRINPRRTLFYGLCDRCSGEEPS